MKFTKILFSLFILVIATSCGDDDDSGYVFNNANLAGTYNIVSFTGMGTETDSSSGAVEVGTSTVTASDFINATITFNESGTITSSGSYTLTETYTEDGVTDEDVYQEDVDFNATYSITGNSITINGGIDGSTVSVENFSQNGLNLVLNFLEIDTDYRFEGSATYQLIRQ
jgi:hypothetical protein